MKMNRAEQVAVVGERHGRHLLLFDQIDQAVDFACPIEQRVVGMAMQMDKWSVRHWEAAKEYGSDARGKRQSTNGRLAIVRWQIHPEPGQPEHKWRTGLRYLYCVE
jgi:hypothetical protein